MPELQGCKFISGANLCVNLTKPERTFPFYNPPGARGEDTFLSTLLHERTVRQIPCYAFHDGFSIYRHLLDGVLPQRLAPIRATRGRLRRAFSARARVGCAISRCWSTLRVRTILKRRCPPCRRRSMRCCPNLRRIFRTTGFLRSRASSKVSQNVPRHAAQFRLAQAAWQKMLRGMRKDGAY